MLYLIEFSVHPNSPPIDESDLSIQIHEPMKPECYLSMVSIGQGRKTWSIIADHKHAFSILPKLVRRFSTVTISTQFAAMRKINRVLNEIYEKNPARVAQFFLEYHGLSLGDPIIVVEHQAVGRRYKFLEKTTTEFYENKKNEILSSHPRKIVCRLGMDVPIEEIDFSIF